MPRGGAGNWSPGCRGTLAAGGGVRRLWLVGSLPFRRLAAAHPDTVDAVFRKVMRKPNFSWAEHGEALLRRRKPWYYKRKRPGVSVIGTHLSELAATSR